MSTSGNHPTLNCSPHGKVCCWKKRCSSRCDQLPSGGADVGDIVMANEHLAGLHFTGSTATFQHLENDWQQHCQLSHLSQNWGATAERISSLPILQPMRIKLQCHPTWCFGSKAKCSAASRVYLPASMWDSVKTILETEVPKNEEWVTHVISATFWVPSLMNGHLTKNIFRLLTHSHGRYGRTSPWRDGLVYKTNRCPVNDPKHRLMQKRSLGLS